MNGDKRILCAMCPYQARCDEIRSGGLCGSCDLGLVCLEGSEARHQCSCDVAKAAWMRLPRKCLLGQSHVAQVTEEDACVRCGAPAEISSQTRWNLFEKYTQIRLYRCGNCNLHEVYDGKR